MRFKLVGILLLFCVESWTQKLMTESEVVNLALTVNPAIKASLFDIKKNQQLEKASFNLENPNINWESPTGEFMTFGVTQTFAFPSVYATQKKLARANTTLSKIASEMTQNEVAYFIKLQYLNAQLSKERLDELENQKQAYESISLSAKRQFEIGDIDFVSMTYASSQYGEMLNEYSLAAAEANEAKEQLKLYTLIKDTFQVSKLVKRDSDILLFDDHANSPSINMFKQGEIVAKVDWNLEKNKSLPGFTIGYQNQGERDTPQNLRLSFGLSVPLWYWQYNASINAAKSNMEAALESTRAEEMRVSSQWNKVKSDALKYLSSIQYYEKTGLNQSNDLISASKRMFDAGQTNYITYMRTLTDAYNIRIKYLDAINLYNQAILGLEFLNGKK